MEKKENENLVYEGNAFYEVDKECMERRRGCREKRNPDIRNVKDDRLSQRNYGQME